MVEVQAGLNHIDSVRKVSGSLINCCSIAKNLSGKKIREWEKALDISGSLYSVGAGGLLAILLVIQVSLL